MTQDWQEMVALVGKDVRVVLDVQPDGREISEVGTLLSLDDAGQCIVRDEMGFAHYCWPALRIEAT